jgi:hypothetical protein
MKMVRSEIETDVIYYGSIDINKEGGCRVAAFSLLIGMFFRNNVGESS